MTTDTKKHERLSADAYFTIDPRPVPGLFYGLPELKEGITAAYDPCCGGGHAVEDVRAQGLPTYASDLHDYDYVDQWDRIDFREVLNMPMGANTIISNFPSSKDLVDDLVTHALSLIPHDGYLALLFNHRFDAAGKRADLFQPETGYYARVVLPFRPWWFIPGPKVKGKKRQTPSVDWTWFVWKKGFTGTARPVHLKPGLFDDFHISQLRARDEFSKKRFAERDKQQAA